jgi:hypothetical protein
LKKGDLGGFENLQGEKIYGTGYNRIGTKEDWNGAAGATTEKLLAGALK